MEVLNKSEDIIRNVRSKPAEAFEAFYATYAGALYGVIGKIIKNEKAAQQALQNTLVKIWTHIHQYDASKGRLFTWMVSIARNEAFSLLRTQQKNQVTTLHHYTETEQGESQRISV